MTIANYSLAYNDRVIEAAREYIARKERKVHPDGYFDKQGRWYPSEKEELTCCKQIREPSRAWKYSVIKHCRSVDHVSRLYGVLKSDIRKYIKSGILPEVEEGYYYKLVAVVDYKYFSTCDGKTKYDIGITLKEEAEPDHGGGYYVYKTIKEAKNAVFPSDSILIKETKVILKVKCGGNYCKYENGKIAFSEIKAVQLVSEGRNND